MTCWLLGHKWRVGLTKVRLSGQDGCNIMVSCRRCSELWETFVPGGETIGLVPLDKHQWAL